MRYSSQSHWSRLPALLAAVVTLVSTCHLPVATAGAAQTQRRLPAESDVLFGLTNVCEIHLRVEPAEWAKLQPPESTDWNIFAALADVRKDAMAGRNFHSEKSSRPGLAGYLGIDHQYGRADITLDGETVHGIGLRYKGNGTFLEGHASGKYSFKVDFDHYQDGLEFRGLTQINLHNNASDPSMLREALSYELFREAGIPCSRVGWAMVKLTVPGRFEKKNLGLYSLVEQVDKRFLKDRFGSAEGLLLKPSTFIPFRHFGEDWTHYERAYFPKTEATPGQRRRLIEFTRLVQQAGDTAFERQVGDYLDMDEFLRFLAVNVLLCNLDSFLGGSQNHYVYLDPETDKFQLWPWDLDHSFGAFPLVGTPETRRKMSIQKPNWGSNRLIERVLAIPRYRQAYHHDLERYLDTIFAENKLRRQIRETADFLRPLISSHGPRALARFERIVADTPSQDEPQALNFFVAKRRESVQQQLAGRSGGERPRLNALPDWHLILLLILAVLAALALNFGVYIWTVVAGFRGSARWGILNLFFYPLAPMIYGWGVRKDLGRRAAFAALASFTVLVLVVVGSIWRFR
jgi:hypothetical protein